MKILVNDIDISKYLIEYKLTAEMNDDSLIIGNAISKKIVMKMDNQDKFFNTFDALIDYPFTIYNDDVNVTGIFTIYEKPEKYTGELSLSLYDNMYKFSQRYDTKLNYPATIKQQILEMSTLTGINIDMSGLSEDTLNKQVNWYDNTISMRNYLGWIAELDGCNCFADEQGKIIFRELASNTYKTIDVESYDKSDQVKFTRVCFDDGILKIEEGEETGNTLYISSNNGYIDSNTSLLSIYNKYKDLSFYSVSNVKMANINGWFLTDLINYNDEFIFMPLSINEVYSGGSYAIANVSGTVNLQNNEIIVNKIDLVTKVKRIQTNVDRNSQSLQILAEDLEDGLGKVSDFEIELGKITLSTSNTEKKIETLTNNLNIELSTKLPLNQVYETATKLFVPDYTKQNQTITATVKLLDGTNITNQCTYVWKRKTSSGVETDLVDGEAFSSNILTISNNVLSDDNPIEYICYAHFNDNEAHASITIGLNIIGQDGESVKGEDGKTYYIHIRYSNDGGTTFTSNGGLVAGAWLGQYTDENETASNDVTRYTWSQIKGEDGTSVTVKSTSITYQASTSGTTAPTGTWLTSVPTVANGQYLWTKTAVTYSDGKSTTAYSVAYKGTDGINGEKGDKGDKGANGTSTYTHVRYSNSSDGSSFDTNPSGKTYIGIYTGTSSTAPTTASSYSWARFKGDTGTKGATGNGINSITYYYAVTTTQTAPAAANVTSTDIPTLSNTNKYLWQKEVIDFTDSTVADKTTVILLAVYGDKGATGAAGVGIKSIANKYAVSNSNSTAPTTWQDSVPNMTATNKYLWNYEIVTKTDNSTSETAKRVIGVYGNTGATGKGIKSITEHYLATTVNTNVTTSTNGWTTTIQTTTTTNKYLWNYETITYTDNSTYDSTPVIIGTHGATGAKGDKGDTGVSVSSVVVEYYLSTSSTSQSGGNWSTTVPTWADGKYIWSRQKTTLSNNTTKTTDPVCITGGKGSTGATGTGITSITTEYYLSTSKTSQSGGSWTTTQPTWTTGKYLWTRSKIVYKNPTSTAYTTPVCDSSWEAVNEIQIGARNLLVYSNKAVYSKDDWSEWFTPTANTGNSCGLNGQGIIFPSDTKVGDTFTLSYDIEWTQFTASSSGTFTAPYCQFYANGSWSSGITNPIGSFGISSAVARAEDGILRLSKTFTITAENQIGANFYYNWRTDYSNGTGKFRIRRMKLEKGNKATDWTPAPEDTISSKIVPTTDTFISSKREDGTFSTTPNTIMLSYELYNCSYAGWYYSSDGIGYTKVTSGQNGLTINSENNLIITNNSSLFDSYKSIVFKLTTDIATCQDTITITKSVDATYLYEEIGDIKNEITKVEQIANSAEQKIDSLNGVIEDKITQTTSTLIDNRLVSVNQQITKFQETINGLDIETVQRKTDELGNVLDNYSEYIHIGGGTLELGKSNSNIKTVITNDKFAIQQDGVDIAYVSAHKLFIESALILTDITVGNDTHGYYRWGLRSNGNYSLIYKKGV